jgi:hypothetical protein
MTHLGSSTNDDDMIRIIISFGILLHGLIHLLGFSREWLFAPTEKVAGKTVNDFSEKTSRIVGLLWLFTSALFISGAVLYAIRIEYFWIPAVAGLLLSQSLIILYWDDAKFGTIANVLVGVVILFASANFQFVKRATSEAQNIITNSQVDQLTVTTEMAEKLPMPVQRWLKKSNVIGRPTNNVVRVQQEGFMRSSPGGSWMPFAAQQVITINPPAFVWNARIRSASIFDIAAIDKYENGHGNMLIKALYIYRVADSSGKEIDEGSLVRYLAEICWYPQAAVSEYLTWSEIDSNRAKVTMSYKGISASATYTFDEEGNVTGIEADRFGDFSGDYRKEKWSVKTAKPRGFDGTVVGAESEVTWKLKDGDFTWAKIEVTSIQ